MTAFTFIMAFVVLYMYTLYSPQGTHLSRYGFRVESAGNVTLSLNIIHQSRYSLIVVAFAVVTA